MNLVCSPVLLRAVPLSLYLTIAKYLRHYCESPLDHAGPRHNETQNRMSALPAPVRSAIKERRHLLDLTQAEASSAGGISAATWNSVERGRSSASGLVRAQICKALGWTVDSIDRLEHGEAATLAAPTERPDPDAPADPGTVAAYHELAEKVNALEAALERFVGKQTLRSLVGEEGHQQSG